VARSASLPLKAILVVGELKEGVQDVVYKGLELND
jgi:hypothetical protein